MKSVRWAVALLVIVAVAVAVAVGVRGDGAAPTATPSPAAPATPSGMVGPVSPAARPTDVPGMLTLTRTSDPEVYAASVAAVVFSLDTRALTTGDYRAALLAGADPLMSDTGLADLAATVEERIPDATRWARMRANQQWSTWTTTAVWEPQTWAEVVTDGLHEPGWVMRNVTGTQTTVYLDGGQERTVVSEPTLTVGMRCPAPGAGVDRCHLTLIGTTVLP